jgi:hypothetical protein
MKKRVVYLSLIYLVIALAFAIILATNLTRYVHYKGDEFFYCLYFLLGLTYVYYFTLFIGAVRKGIFLFFLILFMPLIIAVVAFILGLILMALLFKGTPVQEVYIYSIVFSYLSVGAVVYWVYLKGNLIY